MAQEKAVETTTIEQEIKELIERGKQQGYLTYEELNDFLPEDVVSPEYIDEILLTLDEKGIELIDESKLDEKGLFVEEEEEEEEEKETTITRSTKKIDDPVRIYLTQMGQIPLLERSEEIALAMRIEVGRKSFRRR
ncbi:MAG: RNA polymerase sigma factor region1.1 domain-containing protein, partial [Candidatus Brocadiia bacterium]